MADIAVGRPCPRDGSLTACSGSYSDELLHGQCGCCGQSVSTPNTQYQAPSIPAGYRLVPADWVVEPTPVEPEPEAPVEPPNDPSTKMEPVAQPITQPLEG